MAHSPRKRFGQHFLCDRGVIARLVAAIQPQRAGSLIEIGPGLGALTQELLPQCGRLTVIELDRDLIPELQRRCSHLGELAVISADVLRVDFVELASQRPAPLRVVGNLPYNISTPLIFHLIEGASAVQEMLFMLQLEVVERLIAQPGDKQYGRLSVMVQYGCRCEALFAVPPNAFSPPPQVESAVVRITPRPPTTPAADRPLFAEIVRSAFAQRRKTLRNALKGKVPVATITALGIDPGRRPETLTPGEFVALSNAVKSFTM